MSGATDGHALTGDALGAAIAAAEAEDDARSDATYAAAFGWLDALARQEDRLYAAAAAFPPEAGNA